MTNPHDSPALVNEQPGPAAGHNGPGTLGDRVRSLRLGDRSAGGGGGRLPWVLCLLLLGSTVAFGFQAFRRPKTDEGPASKTGGPITPDGKKADSGDVVLQAKGYIIPAHQIQVSPLVGGRIE